MAVLPTEDDDDGEIAQFQPNQTEVINISGQNIRFEVDGNRYVLRPGQVVSLHNAYALPRQMQKNKDPIPSVIEMLTAKQVLAVTDPRAAHMVAKRK
jgi:hypothetical protein